MIPTYIITFLISYYFSIIDFVKLNAIFSEFFPAKNYYISFFLLCYFLNFLFFYSTELIGEIRAHYSFIDYFCLVYSAFKLHWCNDRKCLRSFYVPTYLHAEPQFKQWNMQFSQYFWETFFLLNKFMTFTSFHYPTVLHCCPHSLMSSLIDGC